MFMSAFYVMLSQGFGLVVLTLHTLLGHLLDRAALCQEQICCPLHGCADL